MKKNVKFGNKYLINIYLLTGGMSRGLKNREKLG